MIPKRLTEARKSKGYTQEQLAEIVGIDGVNTRSRLSSYEVGRTEPPFSLVVKIAKALDYPEYYFYTIDDDLAHNLLDMYKRRIDPAQNNFYSSVTENKKLVEKLKEAEKKSLELYEILRK